MVNREAERKRLVEVIKDSLNKHIGKSCLLAENITSDLLDNGIWVIPHCEAGEIVYLAIESPKPQIKTKVIESIVIGILDDKIVFTDGTCFTIWHKDWDLYNNAVFTSREDAEKALEGSGKK